MVRIEKIWNSKVNVIPLFFLLVSFRLALKAYGFFSVSILSSKTERKLASRNNIHSYTILAKFQLSHLDRVRAIFDHISNTTKVEGVLESLDDKTNTIFMNLECVLPEKEKGID